MKHIIISVCVAMAVGAAALASDQAEQDKVTAENAAERLNNMSDAERQRINTTPIPVGVYPSPPEPSYGPEYGSITFVDTDPGPTIGGKLTMKPAVTSTGKRVDEPTAGITMYMIHWGLEVGAPGVNDDKGSGDLGGDCMGFRDTGHVVAMPASAAGDVMEWDIPHGTVVPEGAVYFVGHALYGNLHNLAKCTQTPIQNKQ